MFVCFGVWVWVWGLYNWYLFAFAQLFWVTCEFAVGLYLVGLVVVWFWVECFIFWFDLLLEC